MIDLHCHILPGLDDGPPSMEMALKMCRIAVEDGITTIVATPHMLNGMFNITPQLVYDHVTEISEALEEASIPLTILPGADIHVDSTLPECLTRGDVLTLADRHRHILVELPQDIVPRELGDLLFQVQLKGVVPIITHPERNIEIQENPGLLKDLILANSLTQITAGSIAGVFGSRIQDFAIKLLRNRMVHLVATDAHNIDHRAPRLSPARKIVEETVGPEETTRIFSQWPAMILAGKHIDPPEPSMGRDEPKKKKRFWDRFLSYA